MNLHHILSNTMSHLIDVITFKKQKHRLSPKPEKQRSHTPRVMVFIVFA